MQPGLRKVALTAHLTFSIGWLGAVAAFLAPAVAAAVSQDVQIVRAASVSMASIISYVIVPLAFGSLLTGLVSALGTPWGLFRHYWVLAKLLLTLIATIVLLVQLEPINDLARMAADPTSSVADFRETRRALLHAGGGVLVLLAIQVLGVYKPRGMTAYGRRVEPRRRAEIRP